MKNKKELIAELKKILHVLENLKPTKYVLDTIAHISQAITALETEKLDFKDLK